MDVSTALAAFVLTMGAHSAAPAAGEPSAANVTPSASMGAAAFEAGLPTDPLAGPHIAPDMVDGTAEGSSLVQRAFDGTIKPLEERPEVAALALLDLTPDERAACDKVLAARSALMDALVRDNLRLLVRARSVREGGEPGARAQVMKEVRDVFAPLSADGTLQQQLARHLTPAHADRFQAITRAYWHALVQDQLKVQGDAPAPMNDAMGDAMNPDQDRKPARAGVGPNDQAASRAFARVAFEALGREIARSYERVAGEGKDRLEQVISALDLNPEQQGRIRAIVTDFAQQNALKPSRLQRLGLFLRISRELTPQQRTRFRELVRQGQRE